MSITATSHPGREVQARHHLSYGSLYFRQQIHIMPTSLLTLLTVKTKNPYYATSWNKGCIIKMHTDGRKSCHHDSPSLSQGPSAICDVSDSLYICSLLIPTKQLSRLTLSKSSHGSGLLQPTLNSWLHSIFSFPGSWKNFPMLLISSS